jgi:hypothetical protein
MTDNDAADPPLSPEEARIAGSLTAEFVERIDAELLKHARSEGRKIAMLVGLAMGNPFVRVPELPDLYYAERIRLLIAKGSLIAEGSTNSMGRCEVRLPQSSSTTEFRALFSPSETSAVSRARMLYRRERDYLTWFLARRLFS